MVEIKEKTNIMFVVEKRCISMKRILSLVLSFTLAISLFSVPVKADGTKIVTIGADLTAEQKQTVLDFFGITDLSTVEEITVNNAEEHETLQGLVPEEQIGTKTYSCAFIEPTNSGGLNVRTANLTYVTDSTLANVLMTAGIENCNLIVTAPFEVSGTGALTGVYKAYESMGMSLDEGKKDAAAEELIVVSELVSNYGGDMNEIITEIKDEVNNHDGEMTDEEIEDMIEETAEKHDITLTDDDIAKIMSLVHRLMALDYDMDAFQTKVNDYLNSISESTGGAMGAVKSFFSGISNFFKNLFGGGKDSDSGSGDSIFDNINTDIFNFD